MAAVSPPFVGWTLAEALERLAEPKSWNAWLDAKTAWEKTHGPITEDDVESSTAQRFADAEWQNVTSAFATVKVGLWQALRDENVMATGQMEGGVIPVTQRDLHSFTRVRWHESSIEHPATGDRLTSIRVYPVVHSVDAASRLVGLGLAEAFFKCVLQDPEARVLAKEIPGRETEHASVFDEGRYPGPYVEYNWDLDVTPSELAYQFVKDVIIDLDGPLPKASIEIVRLCEVIVDRLQALRALLASGKLVASGTHAATGNLVAVDQFQWKRRGMLIDVQNSDVLDGQKYPPTPRWTGLALQAGPMMRTDANMVPARFTQVEPPASAGPGFHVKPTGPDDVRPPTAETPKRKSRKGIARVEASAKDLTECREWLIELMRAKRDERISIKTLWKEARARWPELSNHAFLKARTDAIEESGATAWAAGGAPKKSQNRQSR